jgi:molecular chaperone GrpE
MNTENEVSADEISEPTDQDVLNAQADAQKDAAREAEVEAFAADGEVELEGETDGPDLAREVQELKDKLLRAMAEAENTRRIAAREKADASKYAVVNFARDIVRVADNLGMAMMMVSDEARKEDKNLDNLYVGIDMTMKELLSIFESHGIKPVPTVGQPFDHNIHERLCRPCAAALPSRIGCCARPRWWCPPAVHPVKLRPKRPHQIKAKATSTLMKPKHRNPVRTLIRKPSRPHKMYGFCAFQALRGEKHALIYQPKPNYRFV